MVFVVLGVMGSSPSAHAEWSTAYFESKSGQCFPYHRVVDGQAYGGHRCLFPRGFIDRYPFPIAVYIPDYYVPTSDLQLVLYLHGLSDHTRPYRHDFIDSIYKDDMGISLSMSAENVILVVPSGTGGNVGFNTYMTSKASRFDSFMEQMGRHLQRAGLSQRTDMSRLVVAGHSGAHRPISQILTADCGTGLCYKEKIREIYLLDATYSHPGSPTSAVFAAFANEPGRRFHTVFRGSTVVARSSMHIYNRLHQTDLRDDEAFCEEHLTDLTTTIPCDFACVTNSEL
ncbi:MAG: hypothetical protein QF464_12280, partial [Myxococcota bacterium]|nr:hypothetical protein [Myxococcota bacterium]